MLKSPCSLARTNPDTIIVVPMSRKRPPPAEVEANEEEFEPLFDYSKTVDPCSLLSDDDSDEEGVVVLASSGAPRRSSGIILAKVCKEAPTSQKVANKEVIDIDDDNWLNSPLMLAKPEMPRQLHLPGDNTLFKLRQKRAELVWLEAQASAGAIERVEERARLQAQRQREATDFMAQRLRESSVPVAVKGPEYVNRERKVPACDGPVVEKRKILLRLQDKSGNIHPMRMYLSDKFEKLFSAYAELAGASRADLLFRFDGDQLSPDSTPEEQGLENDDIVEVYKKGIGKS